MSLCEKEQMGDGAHNRTKVRCPRECQEHSEPFHVVYRHLLCDNPVHLQSPSLHL